LAKGDVKVAFDSLLNQIKKALKEDDSVSIMGFGTFSVAKRNARVARNPKTGIEVNVPPKKSVKFKTAARLNEEIN
jgi:DNA-binding protein HU-beta